jgi:cyanophycin synthetase
LKSLKAKGIFVAEHNGQRIVFDILPRIGSSHSPSVAWMDDKGIMREKFAPQNFPIARGGFAETEREALNLFEKIGGTVIVKPRSGSRSRHTTIHITTREQLIKAFWVAKQLSPWVVVEEELKGYVHRVTLVKGKVVGVMRREPPHVVGDGISTIRTLVEKENLNPARHGPLFHMLHLDEEARAELAHQGLAFESIPPLGKLVPLGQKVGRGSGGSTTDFTQTTHPENIELFEKIGAFMQDPLVGVDFIIEDMTRPHGEQQPCGVIECNSLPFIDLHHFPLYGNVVNAAGALWDSVFPGSNKKNKQL